MQAKFFLSFQTLGLTLCLFLLSGCQNYQVSLNEIAIYQPPAVLTEISATDSGLRACLQQWTTDLAITDPNQLQIVNCSHAGISTLVGLNQFRAIEQLNLADNTIDSLVGVTGLAKLSQLNLANNRITDVQVLFQLPNLTWLNLEGNSTVSCQDIAQLAELTTLTVLAPKHCL